MQLTLQRSVTVDGSFVGGSRGTSGSTLTQGPLPMEVMPSRAELRRFCSRMVPGRFQYETFLPTVPYVLHRWPVLSYHVDFTVLLHASLL